MGNVAVIASSEPAIRLHRVPLCHHQCYCEHLNFQNQKEKISKRKKRERTAEHVGQSQPFFITSSEHETDTSNVLFRSLSSDSLNKGARPPRLFHLKQRVQKQPSQDLASHARLSCAYPQPRSLFTAAKVSYLQGKEKSFYHKNIRTAIIHRQVTLKHRQFYLFTCASIFSFTL